MVMQVLDNLFGGGKRDGEKAQETTGGNAAGGQAPAPQQPEPALAVGGSSTRYGLARGLVARLAGGAMSRDVVVREAVRRGIFASASDLRLEEPVTRAEGTVMIMRAFGLPMVGAGEVKRVLKDVAPTHWAGPAVYGAMVQGIVAGFEDESFRPDEALQSDHATALLARGASPPGKPAGFDPRQEWGARPMMEGAKTTGPADAKSLDPTKNGGIRDQNGTQDERVAHANGVVDTLKAGSSKRYKPKGATTYCNVFAHDYAYLMGAFVPRLWWTPAAIAEFEKSGEFPEVVYGKNTLEMRANQLHDWFYTWGHRYGWSHVGDPSDAKAVEAAQKQANEGRVVIVVGDTAARSAGHITAVVPETDKSKASRDKDSKEITGLHQSQAGAAPRTRGADDWYLASKYKGGTAIWVHG